MFTKLKNIYQLGCKELWSLWRDPIMLALIIYTFTLSIYTIYSSKRHAQYGTYSDY